MRGDVEKACGTFWRMCFRKYKSLSWKAEAFGLIWVEHFAVVHMPPPYYESGSRAFELLCADLNRYEFRIAAGILNGLDCVFRRESSHCQRQLAVGCGLYWSPVNALHVFRSAGTAAVHFHEKLRIGHVFLSGLRTIVVRAKNASNRAI